MRDDIPAAALRLSASLPCRTHEQQFGKYDGRESANNTRQISLGGTRYESVTAAARALGISREAVRNRLRNNGVPRESGGHNRKAVAIGGMTYPSVREAMRELHLASNTIQRWIREGNARYV